MIPVENVVAAAQGSPTKVAAVVNTPQSIAGAAFALDTGVDAGHPDYDYLEPWTGEKTLYSAKWTPGDGWVETRNSDTSSGHGTHVGGTIGPCAGGGCAQR